MLLLCVLGTAGFQPREAQGSAVTLSWIPLRMGRARQAQWEVSGQSPGLLHFWGPGCVPCAGVCSCYGTLPDFH